MPLRTAIIVPFPPCKPGETVLLTARQTSLPSIIVHSKNTKPFPSLYVGTELAAQGKPACLRIIKQILLPNAPHATWGMLAQVLQACEGTDALFPSRKGIALAHITMSDKGFAYTRTDESGPAIHAICTAQLQLCHSQGFILPDEPAMLRALVCDLGSIQGYDLIICSGGTGIGPRDTTPEALLPILDHRLPGFEQNMLQSSLVHTKSAVIARYIAGTVGRSLVFALPGSVKAVNQILPEILPAVTHAIAKLQGDTEDCG